ncbi:MAG: hypothetical protein ACREFX_15515 [Opitutaceae bacterium]
MGSLLCRCALGLACLPWPLHAAIDREALVSRHDPVLRSPDPRAELSVGNGEFCFTVDVTGAQTFGPEYAAAGGAPLETMARWAWHSDPNPRGYTLADTDEWVETAGRPVPYPTRADTPAGRWLRRNPGDFPLAVIGWADEKGRPLAERDIGGVDQKLDLWKGEIRSRFRWRGVPVEVRTAAAIGTDAVAISAESAALADGRLRLMVAFPRGHDPDVKNAPPLDWSRPDTHRTTILSANSGGLLLHRSRDDLRYRVTLNWMDGTRWSRPGPHRFLLRAPASGRLEVVATFAPPYAPSRPAPTCAEVRREAAAHWRTYWMSGAAVDFSGSADPRAFELERRIVLSQYLAAIQFGGPVPPAETGLTCSSWYGKHNTEMVWWHEAHFALWGHPEYVAGALAWFERTLPTARATAARRGLPGARWAKMAGPNGRESPGENPFIAWNQPNPIYLAELLYRDRPTVATLDRWRTVVFATADCMAAMLQRGADGLYHLGPPLWIAQEIYDPRTSRDPCFELSYWAFALRVAQRWRLRLGLPRNSDWDARLARLAPLPTRRGRYVALASQPDTWDNRASRHDHPSFLMALGFLPGDGVDPAIMRRTLDATLALWDWKAGIWGWDYPMMAMTATRLGEPEKAMDILLKDGPNNAYTASGQCPQGPGLPLYLPANGALLAAVALMVAGWDGGPPRPGIPRDGRWRVRAEGLHPLPAYPGTPSG